MSFLTTAPRVIASPASRHVLYASGGGALALGIAGVARQKTDEPEADGTSVGRIDRAEAKDLFSGPTAMTTILPVAGALLMIGSLYTKARVLLPEGAVKPVAGLDDALKSVNVVREAGEGAKTKSTYAFLGGTIFASLAAREFVFGDDHYETRHVPVPD